MVDVVVQAFDVMQREVMRQQVTEADVLIEPHVSPGASPSTMRFADYIAAGRTAALAQLGAIETAFRGREMVGRHG